MTKHRIHFPGEVQDLLENGQRFRARVCASRRLHLVIVLAATFACGRDWPQDLGNAQRTGFTPEEPVWPWVYAWSWNGPDASGGAGGHRYHQPQPHEPWEARAVAGGGFVYAPAGGQGLYALRVADGSVAWRFAGGGCCASPAYDAERGLLYLATAGGEVFALDAATGAARASLPLGGPVSKALLLAGGHLYALMADGTLHQLALPSLRRVWAYVSGARTATPPAYSEVRGCAVFCTEDLFVHAVSCRDGSRLWRVKPTALESSAGASFSGGWPVVAERSGLVFVRLCLGEAGTTLWSGGGPQGKWPASRAAIRARLAENPALRNLFALSLEDGREAFLPAVGPAGVEDLRNGQPWLRPHALPVVKEVGGREVAYVPWRCGDTRYPEWDARWDSHLGEMALSFDVASGLAAGDLRFVQFEEHGGWMRITDEACPLSMAGETVFSAHWDVCQSARIADRSPARGMSRSAPILTERRPPVVRHARLAAEQVDVSTHWFKGGLHLMDGRFFDGPGWWVYANVLDPPTPARAAYSEGILPRYTCVANGFVLVQGNGGELFALRHAGAPNREGPSP